MSIHTFEKREELIRLKSKLDAAEQSRILGEPTVSIYEARQRLTDKFEKPDFAYSCMGRTLSYRKQ